MPETDLYEKDYYAWANETAEAIRSGEFSKIDIDALADEVAAIGRQERRTLRSRLEILISYLLERRSSSTIAVQHHRVMMVLQDSPRLKRWLEDNLAEIYQTAVHLAVRDTNRRQDRFPSTCPYTVDELLSIAP
jgi:hypothetical protein